MTAALFASENPVMYAGEIGQESDTGKIKHGNGVTAWNSLGYAGDGSGSAGPTTKRVATNLSYAASTTITDFTFAAAANTTYLVQGVLVITQSEQDSTLFDVDGPSGFTADGVCCSAFGSGADASSFDESGVVVQMINGVGGTATPVPLQFSCMIRTSAASGDVSFDIATSSGEGTNSLLANSCITITAIS
jgi:hypothetical protein